MRNKNKEKKNNKEAGNWFNYLAEQLILWGMKTSRCLPCENTGESLMGHNNHPANTCRVTGIGKAAMLEPAESPRTASRRASGGACGC